MSTFITRIFTTYGNGYDIRCGNNNMTYYGYTKREAKKKFREDFGLKYKHLDFIEF